MKQQRVQVGQVVPDFTLEASGGKPMSLSDFRGKFVVLYFYPKDMTPTCTTQACQFRDDHVRFAAANAHVVGVSPDPVKSHEKFAEKHELPFPLLSDPDKHVCELFGVWQEKTMFGRKYMGVVRSTFLIDPQGVLVKEWRNIRIKGHIDAVLAAIEEHKA